MILYAEFISSLFFVLSSLKLTLFFKLISFELCSFVLILIDFAFKKELEERLNVPVFLVDERLTTVEADEIMAECGIPRSDFGLYVDMIAAEIILQDYLNNMTNTVPKVSF